MSCHVCLYGHYSTAGATECTACKAGQYADKVESVKCTKCAAGKYGTDAAQITAGKCLNCMTGQYNTAEGQSSCDSSWKCCSQGEFMHFDSLIALVTTEGTCKTCPVGKFQDASEVCSPDRACKDIAEVYCKCNAGEFLENSSPLSGGTCTKCPAGKYKPVEADKRNWVKLGCDDCPAGTFGAKVQQVAADSCESCQAGNYSATPGASSCTSCQPGTFSPPRSTSCSSCRIKTDWTPWSTCSSTCGGGTKTRTRTLQGSLVDELDREDQCPTTESRACNTKACPTTNQCHFLKCRYAENPATGKFGIQVYHHGKEPHNVHHCKLYELADGKNHCMCSCWNDEVTKTTRRLLADSA